MLEEEKNIEENKAEEKNEDFPSSFVDEEGRKWDIYISVPVAHEFCRQNAIKLGRFLPGMLDAAQVIDLAFLATRKSHYGKTTVKTKDAFLKAIDGPSYREATNATESALINFTLRTLPVKDREMTRKMFLDLKAKIGKVNQQARESLGNGEMFSDLVESPE